MHNDNQTNTVNLLYCRQIVVDIVTSLKIIRCVVVFNVVVFVNLLTNTHTEVMQSYDLWTTWN